MMFPNRPSKTEIRQGLIYMAVSLIVLPLFLPLLPLTDSQMNFLYYSINFLAVVLILRRFLIQNLKIALDHPFPTLYYGILAYLGHETLGRILAAAFSVILPTFQNVNDQNVYAMISDTPWLMAVGVMFLVPVVEECFYRGIIFRGLFDRSPVLAYAVSMLTFSAIHVVGYMGSFDPLQLLLCFVQYLPAGYCLCFAYRRSDTIISPILVHSIINALGVYSAVR